MKIKQIIGAILMTILTILCIVFGILLSIKLNINSNAIKSVIENTNYLTEAKQDVENMLANYLVEEKANKVLENIDVKSNIYKMVETLEDNNTLTKSEEIKEDVAKEILKVLDSNVEEKTKLEFAERISSVYIKTVFPVSEYSVLSAFYVKYMSKVNFLCVILVVLMIGIYIYLATGKKTDKWNIIAMYNTVLINIIVIIFTLTFKDIVIGNVRTTALIIKMISSIRNTLIIYTLVILIVAIISNYIAYFKKHSK